MRRLTPALTLLAACEQTAGPMLPYHQTGDSIGLPLWFFPLLMLLLATGPSRGNK